MRCVPAGQESDDADPEAPDEIGYADGMLDLGEAAAEQLALALDPYPRSAGRGAARTFRTSRRQSAVRRAARRCGAGTDRRRGPARPKFFLTLFSHYS